jgi:hypothetical protein
MSRQLICAETAPNLNKKRRYATAIVVFLLLD